MSLNLNSTRPRNSILDKPLSRGKNEVSLSLFALLFSETVQYCQTRVTTVVDLQSKYVFLVPLYSRRKLWLYYNDFYNYRLHDLGKDVGVRLIDLYFVRERNSKRETKLINILLFIKTTLWKTLFGKEADKLEHANDDERTYYIIEKDALVNKFISVPKDKSSLNCAVFTAGIVQSVLYHSGFVSISFRVLFKYVQPYTLTTDIMLIYWLSHFII